LRPRLIHDVLLPSLCNKAHDAGARQLLIILARKVTIALALIPVIEAQPSQSRVQRARLQFPSSCRMIARK
jgi:hypothetical protein